METSNLLGTIEFDLDDSVYRARYDPETTAPSVAVVDLLQAIEGVKVTDLEPLYEIVDPEGLDLVLEHDRPLQADDSRPPKSVSVPYRDLILTVRSDGVINVTAQADTERCGEELDATSEE
ncbi:hypothetical protein OB955_21295 [Halobacteria archaeon AArc-m2/3/4]|uniref:Halobacterial output domain-containing protein n=1 Tax=Natronoglomus mannanivorans TaxID=2979990 RepID=A0AAP3E4K0_9EURY|nr:hypothetical protein [Halobacteria archaeon AArc-xg1-1]MCU4975241.1 hypothetical protein [Halobacteria archaeon AArc-m2/3/4]